MGKIINSDLEWYTSKSRKKGLPPRCPYAAARRCPRYCFSLLLAGEMLVLAPTDDELKTELIAFWADTDLDPSCRDEEPGYSGYRGKRWGTLNHFCPEVAHKAFGFFSNQIINYSDNLDFEAARKQLRAEGNQPDSDWQWYFEYVKPCHYTDCPLYSLLSLEGSKVKLPHPGPITSNAQLSEDEEAEFRQHLYKSERPIFISGRHDDIVGNLVRVGTVDVYLTAKPFSLFLRLVLELFRNKRGYVHKKGLATGGYSNNSVSFHEVSRLRDCFPQQLVGAERNDFIETKVKEHIRLSTHPSIVKYDKVALLQQDDAQIVELAKLLP